MKRKLTAKEYTYVASMLFGLFSAQVTLFSPCTSARWPVPTFGRPFWGFSSRA